MPLPHSRRTIEERAFARFVQPVLAYPKLTWLFVIALTVITTIGNFKPELILDLFSQTHVAEPFLPKNDQESIQRPPDVEPFRYGSGGVILVAESDNFFTPECAELLREVLQSVKELPFVQNVVWLEDTPPLNIFGLSEPIFPRKTASQTRFDAARAKAIANPLIGGQLLSLDGTVLLLMIEIDWFLIDSDKDFTDNLRDLAADVAAKYPNTKISFSVTGDTPLRLLAASAHESNEMRYQLIGYGVILLMAVFLFRGISAVIIVATAPILGVYWTLGTLHFFDLHDNPFNSAVLPVLISLVGFTDGVHMMVQIRRNRAAGKSNKESAADGMRDVGFACFLTSLTTAIGFSSLALAHHEIVREFGWCCVIGVTLTLVSVLTVIPLLCASRLGNTVATGYGKNLVDKNLERISVLVDFVVARKAFFAWSAIFVTAGLLSICTALRPDERQTSMLPDDEEAVIALRKIDRKLGGMDTGSVIVQWNSQIPANSAELGLVMTSVNDVLARESLIGSPLSIYNLVQALPGTGAMADRMSLLELMPPPLKRAFYTPEYQYAEARFRVQDLGIAQYNDTFQRIEQGLAAIQSQHPNFQLSLDGNAVWRWRNLYRIVLDLAYSLGTAALVIFLVLSVVYRSVRIGLISVIPNVFPLAATGVLLVVTGKYLEIVSVCAFTVCLGIAVDDTIHFLTRYRDELAESPGDVDQAISRAFVGVGTGLIMTTTVLVVGFSTALTSEARDTRVFVTMGMLTIATALLGDLLFLPAMLAYFQKRTKPPLDASSDFSQTDQVEMKPAQN